MEKTIIHGAMKVSRLTLLQTSRFLRKELRTVQEAPGSSREVVETYVRNHSQQWTEHAFAADSMESVLKFAEEHSRTVLKEVSGWTILLLLLLSM